MKHLLLASLSLLVLGVQSAAAQTPVPPPLPCDMNETAELRLTISGSSDTVQNAYGEIESTLAQVVKIGEEAKLETFELASEQYNINSQPARNLGIQSNKLVFSYNANVQYKVQPVDKAKDVLAQVVENGIQGNLSVRKNRSPHCRNR